MAGAATVDKALDILFYLHSSAAPRPLGEIARALGLAKSSCHRLLTTLVERELVEQDATGRYRPGLALLALGLGVQRREPVVELARPHLETEVDHFGETVFVVGARRGRLIVLDQCAGRGFLRAAPAIGDEIPADVTAAGKLYRLHGALEGADGAPIPTEEQEAIRRRGHAVNRDAWIEGLSVLAVPVWQRGFDGRDRLAAVLALAAASTRFDALGEARIAERLAAAAGAVSARLGVRADVAEKGMEGVRGERQALARRAAVPSRATGERRTETLGWQQEAPEGREEMGEERAE